MRSASPTLAPDAGRLASFLAAAREWAAGRNPWVRAPLVLLFAWIGVRQFADPNYASLFSPINLGIHEAGHIVFSGLGEVLRAAGGTLLQCIAPLVAGGILLRQPDFFGGVVCLGWLSTNLHHVGTYMADADAMRLPLVTVGPADTVCHDWRFLFERFDVLHRCEAIGAATRGLGHVTMLATLVGGVWLLSRMRPSRRV